MLLGVMLEPTFTLKIEHFNNKSPRLLGVINPRSAKTGLSNLVCAAGGVLCTQFGIHLLKEKLISIRFGVWLLGVRHPQQHGDKPTKFGVWLLGV